MGRAVRKYLRIFKDSKYVLLINIADRIFSFLVFLILSRKFSPADYGQIVTIFTLTTIFVTIFDFGLPLFLQRETALYKARATELFSKIFTISLILFVIYLGAVFGFAAIFYKDIPLALIAIISVMMYESSLINVCSKSLSGILDFKSQYSALWMSRLYTFIFFTAGVFYLHFNLNLLMLVMLTGFLLNLFLLIQYLYKNKINLSISHFSFPEAKAIMKLSIPLGLAVLFNFMYDKIDILLISKLKDFSDVAYYNVGYGLYKSAMLSYSFILASGFSQVSSIGRNKYAVSLFFRKYLNVILLISLITSLVLFFLSGPLIKLIYTAKFAPSIAVLQILSAALAGNALNNLTGIILNGIGLFKAVMYITLFGLVLNIALNIVFIPLYGINGASVVTAATEYFIFFFELYYVIKVLNLKKA